MLLSWLTFRNFGLFPGTVETAELWKVKLGYPGTFALADVRKLGLGVLET